MRAIKVGDKVAYSVQWLRSVGMVTGDIPHARGIVTELTKLSEHTTLARIQWDRPDIPERVNVANLALVGLNAKFSAC